VCGVPDARNDLGVTLAGAVRKVEAEDVDAGGDQFSNGGFAVGHRTECGDDLGLSHRGYRVQGTHDIEDRKFGYASTCR
jgi:hypothetical protein